MNQPFSQAQMRLSVGSRIRWVTTDVTVLKTLDNSVGKCISDPRIILTFAFVLFSLY